MEYIAFDSHKRYTFAVVTDESDRIRWEGKIHHARGSIRAFLEGRELGSVVALEAVGRGRERICVKVGSYVLKR